MWPTCLTSAALWWRTLSTTCWAAVRRELLIDLHATSSGYIRACHTGQVIGGDLETRRPYFILKAFGVSKMTNEQGAEASSL
jgi:hypothetical protein